MTYATTIDAIRADLARRFAQMTDAQIDPAGRDAILEYGGIHVQPPRSRDSDGPHSHTVSLLAVMGEGDTLAEALREWTTCTLRIHAALEQERAA